MQRKTNEEATQNITHEHINSQQQNTLKSSLPCTQSIIYLMAIQDREGLLPIRWRRPRGNGVTSSGSPSRNNASSSTTSSTTGTRTTAAATIYHNHQRTRISILRNRKGSKVSFMFLLIILICLMAGILVNFASLLSPTPTSTTTTSSRATSSNDGEDTTYTTTTHKEEVKERTQLFKNEKVPLNSNASINMWIAGMAADADKIHSNVKDTLIQLNCHHQVGIHVILKLKHQIDSFQHDLNLMQ